MRGNSHTPAEGGVNAVVQGLQTSSNPAKIPPAPSSRVESVASGPSMITATGTLAKVPKKPSKPKQKIGPPADKAVGQAIDQRANIHHESALPNLQTIMTPSTSEQTGLKSAAPPASASGTTTAAKVTPKPKHKPSRSNPPLTTPVTSEVTSDANASQNVQPESIVAAKSKPKPNIDPKPQANTFKPLKLNPVAPAMKPATPNLPISIESSLDFNGESSIEDIYSVIRASWLERMFQAAGHPVKDGLAFSAIASRYFAQKPSTHSINVALRFVIARIHTCFQLGRWDSPTTLPPVIAASESCAELWVIVTEDTVRVVETVPQNESSTQKRTLLGGKAASTPRWQKERVAYLIIGQTGDVVQKTSIALDVDISKLQALNNFELREDWKAFLQSAATGTDKTSAKQGIDSTLMKHIKTKYSDEFDCGIAKVWLEKVDRQNMFAEVKIAQRYVLNNVVLQRYGIPHVALNSFHSRL